MQTRPLLAANCQRCHRHRELATVATLPPTASRHRRHQPPTSCFPSQGNQPRERETRESNIQLSHLHRHPPSTASPNLTTFPECGQVGPIGPLRKNKPFSKPPPDRLPHRLPHRVGHLMTPRHQTFELLEIQRLITITRRPFGIRMHFQN